MPAATLTLPRAATAPAHSTYFDGETVRTLALAGDRTLSYALYGAADGPLVVALDGPGSRGMARAADAIARGLGIRVVAPDRPGFFASTPGGDRTIADWPEDHAALLDALGVERAGIMSQSGGTPYGLAAAASLSSRTTGLAMLGAVAPLYEDVAYSAAGTQLRVGSKLARRAPWLLRAILRSEGRKAAKDPAKAGAKLAKTLPPADEKVLADPAMMRIHVETSAEILTSDPSVIVREIRMLSTQWNIDLHRITAPRAFWTGDSDASHPVPHAQWLAERMGDPPVHAVPEAATFGLVPIYADALKLAAGV
jgi:pimeloyl-ACP methyl ester carboxylesterase